MLKDTTICFIGSGAMATAMIAGLSKKDLIEPSNVVASDPYPGQLEKLAGRYQVNTTQNNSEAIKDKDIVVLSIKPQNLEEVGAGLQGQISPDSLILSIIAGAPIRNISRKFHHYRVVRVMPNTPARVGKGMSVWTCTEEVSETQKSYTRAILEALGEEIFVEDEDYLDMATALSGTGPAYFYLLVDMLVKVAEDMGLDHDSALALVLETARGAGEMAEQSGETMDTLINRVRSPGGTTAAAFDYLDGTNFRDIFSAAVTAARDRAVDLADQAHRQD